MLAHEFTELAEEMMLTDMDGEVCHVEEEEEGHSESINSNSVNKLVDTHHSKQLAACNY